MDFGGFQLQVAGLRMPSGGSQIDVHQIFSFFFFVTPIIVPEKTLKLMRDRRAHSSDPSLKRFRGVQLLFSECLAFHNTRRL